MPTDNKELARVLESLDKAGISLSDIGKAVQQLDARGLLPKMEDPLREKIRRWAIDSGVLDEIQNQYSGSWSFSVTVRDGWSIQFVNRRKLGKKSVDGGDHHADGSG